MQGTGVSILIPCFNREPFLAEAIESALAQTLPPTEVIVVDDGSTDRTAAVALEYVPRVRFHRFDTNQGKSAALNWATERASGEYILILDSDDVLEPDAIAVLSEYLDRHSDVGVAFGHASLFDNGGVIAAKHPITEAVKDLPGQHDAGWIRFERSVFFDATLERSHCPMASTMFRKACLDAVGPHNERVRSGQDWEMLVRLAARFQFAFIDKVLCHMRRHSSNLSLSPDFELDRHQSQVHLLDSILRAVELTEAQRRRIELKKTAAITAFAQALIRAFRPEDARRLFQELSLETRLKPSNFVWYAASHLSASTLRAMWAARNRFGPDFGRS